MKRDSLGYVTPDGPEPTCEFEVSDEEHARARFSSEAGSRRGGARYECEQRGSGKHRIKLVADASDVDVVITEIGGTVGDIESLPFLEAIRQFPVRSEERRVGKECR